MPNDENDYTYISKDFLREHRKCSPLTDSVRTYSEFKTEVLIRAATRKIYPDLDFTTTEQIYLLDPPANSQDRTCLEFLFRLCVVTSEKNLQFGCSLQRPTSLYREKECIFLNSDLYNHQYPIRRVLDGLVTAQPPQASPWSHSSSRLQSHKVVRRIADDVAMAHCLSFLPIARRTEDLRLFSAERRGAAAAWHGGGFGCWFSLMTTSLRVPLYICAMVTSGATYGTSFADS
ncbi:hypothetical protein J6590_044021 [Homalodisca vitripennis]|nr:hypothetical protein J6590_044021 [Homalodisca vitripennis]